MTIEKILYYTNKRVLFDNLADEFHNKTLDEKLTILASLNYYKLLDKAIKDYKSYQKGKQYILDQLKPTLLFYYSKLTSLKDKLIIENESEKTIINKLKEQLSLKIEPNYSIDTFIDSFLNNNQEEYKKQKFFFNIDLNDDITNLLEERDKAENKSKEESYLGLYDFYKNNLLANYNEQKYPSYMVDQGMYYQVEYLIKHFFHKNKLAKQDYENAIKYAIRILYFNQEPYHKFYLVRVNFDDTELIEKFYSENEIAIHFNTNKDFADYQELENNGKPKQQYISRWKNLFEELKNNDVIVIASYKGIGYKFGIIPKGTNYSKTGKTDVFYLKAKYKNKKNIKLDQNPTVQTIIPSNVTISRVRKKNYKLRKEYYKMIVNLPVFEFDDNSYEILVNEWLRSDFAPEKYRIKYQLLKVGGNKKDIDIYAITRNGEKIIVQVSDTSDKNTIKKKINKLKSYDNFIKLFFFNVVDETEDIISLKRVINDFKNDDEYKELLNEI